MPPTDDDFIRDNIRLVHSVAKRYANPNCEYDDLLGAGMEGLWKARERYDPDSGYKFSTFAVSYIRGYIQKRLRDINTTIHIPSWAFGQESNPVTMPYEALSDVFGSETDPTDGIYLDWLLSQLDDRSRTIVIRRHIIGDTWREIGDDLGMSYENARQIAARAIVSLQKHLA